MDAVVIQVLEQACSQDPNVLKQAEQTLKRWETGSGFYTALYNVFSDRSLAVNVRWMAVVYFKNGVDKYWRSTAPGAIADDEKEFLRQRLTTIFDEPVDQLAVQMAVLIAKIARFDCPREWNTLIPTLLKEIGSENSLQQHRALFTLHQVIKTLASKRLGPDQGLFRELTSNILNFILNLWNTFTESFFILASSGVDTDRIQESLKKALLSLKILKNLLVYGFREPSESEGAMLFLKLLFERARTSLECRKTLISRGITLQVCDKFIVHMTKILLAVLESHKYSYLQLYTTTLEFTVFYCFTEAGQSLTFERFSVQCMDLLGSVLRVKDVSPRKSRFSSKLEARSRSIHILQLRKDYFNAPILTEICTWLVTRYLLMTPDDLALWDEDTENFALDDVGEARRYNLRMSAESVFVAIFSDFHNILAPVIVDMMQKHHQPVDPQDLEAILLKDAVYKAVGLSAFELHDEVDFDQWFSTTLKQELKIRGTNYRIIRRRVCWLIGKWSHVKMSPELRPEVYKLMVELLNPEEDLCIRLTASDVLKSFIGDFAFDSETFNPFLEASFAMLITLLKQVNQCYSKMRILDALSFMIERVGGSIKPHVISFAAYLSALWQESDDEDGILRCAILSTLVQMENALGPQSIILESLVVGAVEFSCDINQCSHLYLFEDGLQLWLALLENAPLPTPAIMDLFGNMPALLDSTSEENFMLCIDIMQAYVLLSPLKFLSERGTVIVDTIKGLIGDMSYEGLEKTLKFIEMCLKAVPQESAQLMKPLLGRLFDKVYQRTESLAVIAMCVSIVARVLLISKDIFGEVTSELAREIGGDATDESVLARIIQVSTDLMSKIGKSDLVKLLSLALCSLLGPNSPPIVFQQFSSIITSIIETLNDITTIDDTGCAEDLLITPSDRSSPSQYENADYETEHEKRKMRLSLNDLVYTVSLKESLQSQLSMLRRIMGDEQFQQVLLTLPADVDQQLKKYTNL